MNLRQLLVHVLKNITGQPEAHLRRVVAVLEAENPRKPWKTNIPPKELRELEKACACQAETLLADYKRILETHKELVPPHSIPDYPIQKSTSYSS